MVVSKRSRSVKSRNSQGECSPNIGPGYRVMEMFEDCLPKRSDVMESSRIASLADSLAKTSVWRALARVLQAHEAGYGLNSPGSFARFDTVSSSWRTSQLCLVEDLDTFSETWPRSGMMLNGIAFRLPTLVQDSFGTAFGLWPTPNATAFKGGRLSPRRGVRNPERNNWQDWCSLVLGQRYPVPETAEQVMGFQMGYTEIKLSETP